MSRAILKGSLWISFQSKQTSLKLLLYFDWANGGAKNSDYLPVDLVRVRLCDQHSLVVKDKLNLVLYDKRSLAEVPIYFSGLLSRYRDGVNWSHQIKNVFWRKICTASIELKNKLVILCYQIAYSNHPFNNQALIEDRFIVDTYKLIVPNNSVGHLFMRELR